MKELKKIILAIVSVGGFLLALGYLIELYARNIIMANFVQLDENKFLTQRE